ncbi:ubiquitin-related domain-containing protein [Phellopilus nigrolimitatus]|nr:ubiquitin-related domain-containing protein [Phellopilus nigrolimitatus]
MAGDKDTLIGMGFEPARVDWALRATNSAGLQSALDFLFAHPDDPIPDPAAQGSASAASRAGDAAIDVDDEDAEALRAVYGGAGGSGAGGEAGAGVEAKSIKCAQCGKTFKNTALANFHAEKSGHDQFEESVEEIKPLTEEERAEKLAELRAKLAEKRAVKSVQEAEEAKANEAIRRKAGRDAGKIRDDLMAKETLKAAQAVKREKEQEAAARLEVKRKIEQDKEERRQRAEREKALREGGSVPATAAPVAVTPAPGSSTATGVAGRDYKDTRLQIRLASGGKPYVTSLPSESTLREVAEYLAAQTLSVDVETVNFAMHYPRKQFSRADFSKTLRELGLTPSAVREH